MTELKEEMDKKCKFTYSNFSLPRSPYHLTLYRARHLTDISEFGGYVNVKHNLNQTRDRRIVLDNSMILKTPFVIRYPVKHVFQCFDEGGVK